MFRGIEHEGRGLVDRHRARAGGRVGDLSRVQAQGTESEFSVRHFLDSQKNNRKGNSNFQCSPQDTNTLALAWSTLLEHEVARRNARQGQVRIRHRLEIVLVNRIEVQFHAKSDLSMNLNFFVFLRVLKGYSTLTRGYSCLRGEIFG